MSAPREAQPPLLNTRARLVLGGGALALVLLWWTSGSLLVALLVVVLLVAAAGLAVVVAAWARPRPEPLDAPTTERATTDFSLAPPAGAPVRRALRLALARPWVHGDGLLRATATRLDGQDALVWTPRGQQVAAPHLWVEWHPVDAAEVAARRPLEALARELAEGYVTHGSEHGVRRLAERTWVHLLVSDDVPLGRVVVTAAFSEPQQPPVAAACASTSAPLAPARGAAPPPRALRPSAATPPPGVPAGRAHPGAARPGPPGPSGPSRPAGTLATMATVSVPARLRTVMGRVGRAARVAGLGPSPTTRAVLVVDDPAGSRLEDAEVDGRVELGRDPACEVAVDHPSVSWRHVALAPDPSGGGWTVTDLGSTNGTTVDGVRIAGPTPLPPGSVLALGTDGPRVRLQVPEPGPAVRTDATRTAPVVSRCTVVSRGY
ncbi:FHA domain-containing protein [Actinomycetospora sp.]|uniref:FHA domain-containing protein n=1 Tax=Actinomycetospora sp. TaxID=1872135 RepID=UPI002F421852